MEPQEQSAFEGFGLVEIMGHRRAVGEVKTKCIGTAAFLHVVTPAVEAFQKTLDKPQRIGYEYCEAGSVVEFSRAGSEIWIGSGSIYAITPISEEDLLQHAPLDVRIVERIRKEIAAPEHFVAEDEEATGDEEEIQGPNEDDGVAY